MTSRPARLAGQLPQASPGCPLAGFCGSGAIPAKVESIASDGADLTTVATALSGLGFAPSTPERASLSVRRGQVRYFREADAAIAAALAERTGYDILDLTSYRPLPETATIEIRVPDAGGGDLADETVTSNELEG